MPRRGRIVVIEDGRDLIVRPFKPAEMPVLELDSGLSSARDELGGRAPYLAKSAQSLTARRGRKGVALRLVQLCCVLDRSGCFVHAAR